MVRIGDTVKLQRMDGLFKIRSISRISRRLIQVVLENSDNVRLCLIRQQSSFSTVKNGEHADKFEELLAEL